VGYLPEFVSSLRDQTSRAWRLLQLAPMLVPFQVRESS
jgi:hypothetical protein